jgi:hypothetical protein
VYLFVVAHTSVVERLARFLAEHGWAKETYVNMSPGSASKTIALLFPRMISDEVPSNQDAREYLQDELKAVVLAGLTELAKQKPKHPIQWLAHYLLDSNPRSPPISTS